MKNNGGRMMIYNKKTKKYEYEYRVEAEKKLGRKLRPGEVVHHKDGKKGDDRPSNLQVTTRGRHNTIDPQLHHGGRKPSRKGK